LFLEKAMTIRVGALGRFRFPRGYYMYIGSAMNGLDGRVRRHLARDKQLFWHIDYFLKHARIVDVWTQQGRRRLECAWAARVLALETADVIAERFGASDCRCRTHLIRLTGRSARK
jgi:Uri superfamily endonuclease